MNSEAPPAALRPSVYEMVGHKRKRFQCRFCGQMWRRNCIFGGDNHLASCKRPVIAYVL